MAVSYTRDPSRVDKALRHKGIVVVMAREYARNPQDVVNTIQAISEAGYLAEVTFRIPEGIVKEAMGELRKRREETFRTSPNDPMVIGVGSVVNPRELEAAIEMGFDMIVGPDTCMEGCREPIEIVRMG